MNERVAAIDMTVISKRRSLVFRDCHLFIEID